MRATLADARLLGYAGRFVWLALDFDAPANAAFFARHGAIYTPTFYILDPHDEHAIATHLGAMTLDEVTAFLDRAARPPATAGDLALMRGDALLATGRTGDASDAYADAVRLGGADRDRAVASLTQTLRLLGRFQPCAEIAVRETPGLSPRELGRVVVEGLACSDGDPGAHAARATLEPLAVRALASSALDRDVRFALYRELVAGAPSPGAAAAWGDRWFAEIDAIAPRDDDDRTSLDIARVEAARELGDPARAIAALLASERAMPVSYVPSLRLAQLELEAKRYADAIAACERGLAHATGPLARAWLLELEATAFVETGRPREARLALERALAAAREIAVGESRDRNVARITKAIEGVPP